MKHAILVVGCAALATLLAAGCGGAGAPVSSGGSPPPATHPHSAAGARYLAGVAVPLRDWQAALDGAAASLRRAAGRPPGSGRRSAAAAVSALAAATGRAGHAVGVAPVPGSMRRGHRALVRSIALTEIGARAAAVRLHRWPFLPAGRVRALALAARAAHAWARALGAEAPRAPVAAWAPRLAAGSASLAHAARAALAPPTLAPGAMGSAVAGLQRRLAELRYLPAGYATGSFDDRTMQAVIAFQGWEGLPRDGIAGPVTLGRVVGARTPQPWSAAGRHIEIHTAAQVLLLVDGGAVVRAIHVSTAAPGHVTPYGTFAIYRKEVMSWSVPFQVWMPYANYFTGGYAIHEYPDVPPYPASHGCVRVPAGEALVVWDFATLGTPVVIG